MEFKVEAHHIKDIVSNFPFDVNAVAIILAKMNEEHNITRESKNRKVICDT